MGPRKGRLAPATLMFSGSEGARERAKARVWGGWSPLAGWEEPLFGAFGVSLHLPTPGLTGAWRRRGKS